MMGKTIQITKQNKKHISVHQKELIRAFKLLILCQEKRREVSVHFGKTKRLQTLKIRWQL
jgi:hypothetical protein